MSLQLATAWGKSPPSKNEELVVPDTDRCLTLMTEGAALNMPELDAELYRIFRANVSKLALQIPDRLPDGEKLKLIRAILQEFENYRNNGEEILRQQVVSWRELAATLYRDLLASLGMDANTAEATALAKAIPGLTTAEEIQNWRTRKTKFLHPLDAQGNPQGIAALKTANRSAENHNAAGLRGGSCAIKQLGKIMTRGEDGYIALFKLSCLDVVTERFGVEVVEDCLMAVSSYLISTLRSNDTVYLWNDSCLLAILQGRPSEQILAAELQRVISHNRENSVIVARHTIMLRIPLSFELTPIKQLKTVEDLYKIVPVHANKW
jgi:GGDEF domain-containing protein